MRVAVVGLGAVGGLLAHRLAAAGHEVSALARGATLAAVRERGLRLREPDGRETTVAVDVADDAARLGPHELVLIALKGPALATSAAATTPLLGPETVVLPAMNGVPWWFAGDPTAPGGQPLASIDPHGLIGAALPVAQTLGCVVHLAASVPEPGVVSADRGDRLIVGEPAGGVSARVEQVVGVLGGAGFSAEASPDIRREIWFKLWGNMTVNPVSALTGATVDRILADDLVRGLMLSAMAEAAEVGAAVGCPITESGEERLDLARQLGAFRTSMLQDVDAGRPLELDALTGVVRELGARHGVATPGVDALHGLARLMAATRGLV